MNVWFNVKVHVNEVISLVDTKRKDYILSRKESIILLDL